MKFNIFQLDFSKINLSYICLGIGLIVSSIINFQDVFYVPSPFFAYELPKFIYGLLRFSLIAILLIFSINNLFKLNLEYFFIRRFDILIKVVYWVGPVAVFFFYAFSIYFFKSNFTSAQKDFGILGVVTSWAPFSDFGILNWQVSCFQDGISPYLKSQCNNFIPLNYSMLWVYFLNYIGGGKGFEASNLYLCIVLLMLLFFCSVSYLFVKDKRLSLFYLLAISSPPIQTLFFQQNNDLHLSFILFFISIFISYFLKNNVLYYGQIVLLAFLAALKIYFLPVLFFYSIFIYFSNKKIRQYNINIWIALTIILFSSVIALIDIRGIYINSHVPFFYTYGFNSLKIFFGYFHTLKPEISEPLFHANLFFLAIFFACIALSLRKTLSSILVYSNSVATHLPLSSIFRTLEIVCGSIYLLTSTVMPSYDLRLWSLIATIVCTLSNIYCLSIASNKPSSRLSPNLFGLISFFSLIALWVTPFSIYFYSFDIVIFLFFILFYFVHLLNLFIKPFSHILYKSL